MKNQLWNKKLNRWSILLIAAVTLLFLWIGYNEAHDLRVMAVEYGFRYPWGMFFKRATLIGGCYLFLILNIILDIRWLWNQIYEKRWWIAIALFLFFLVNKYNFSSLYMYDTWIQPGQGDEYSYPVFGEARLIRTDEYLVDIPRFFSAEYVDYGPVNHIIMATEHSNLEASGLQLCYAALAEPEMWGFYMFGSEYGLSWMWSLKMIFGFLFVFEVCMILTKNHKLISLFGAVLIHFSQMNMWWSMRVAWLWCGCAAIYFFHKFIYEKRDARRILWGAATAIFVANFCVSLYPAWQVPSAYIFLGIVIWILMESREVWIKYKAKDIALVGMCIVFVASLVGAYVFEIRDYIVAIMNTSYPGQRSDAGGYAITEAFRSYYSAITPFVEDMNPSEKSCFYCVFPLGFFTSIYVLIKKKGKSFLLGYFTIVLAYLTWYCLMPIPMWLAKITLMTFSIPVRAVDMVGFLSCLLLVISMAELSRMGGMHKILTAGMVALNVLIPFIYELSLDELPDGEGIFAIMMILTAIVQYVMIADVKPKLKTIGIVVMTVFILYTGLSIHPLMTGISTITSKPIAKEIQKIVEVEPEAKWITINSRITQSFVAACGAPTYNSINYVPNMEFWEALGLSEEDKDLCNRYAHIYVALVDAKSSVGIVYDDCIWLDLSYDDVPKLDISYIYSETTISNAQERGYELVVEQENAYIYRVK